MRTVYHLLEVAQTECLSEKCFLYLIEGDRKKEKKGGCNRERGERASAKALLGSTLSKIINGTKKRAA